MLSEPIGNCSKSNASSSHEGESASGGFCVSSTLTHFELLPYFVKERHAEIHFLSYFFLYASDAMSYNFQRKFIFFNHMCIVHCLIMFFSDKIREKKIN